MSDQDVLLSTLRSVQHRLLLNRAMQYLVWAALWLLGAAVMALLLNILTPHSAGWFGLRLPATVFVAATAAILIVTAFRALRMEPIAQAASEADQRGGLHDTLGSALWFSGSKTESPWVSMVLSRAAAIARGLDVRKLIPLKRPEGLRWLALLAIVAGGLWWFDPKLSHSSKPVPVDQTKVAPAEDEDVVALRALIDEAQQRGDLEAKTKLEKTLAALERKDATREHRRAALDDARDFIRQRNLDANADVENLQQLANAMGGREEFREVADALKQGDVQQAAEALKQLSAKSEARDKNAPKEYAAGKEKMSMDELKAALQSAAQNTDSGNEVAGQAQDKLQKAVRGLEELSKKLEVQERLNGASKRLDSVSIKMERQATLRANRYGQQEGQSTPEGSPETGNAQIQGGTMFRMGAVAQEKKDETRRDGGRAGDSSGDAEGNPVLGDEYSKVEAKYRLEALQSAEDARKDDKSDAAFYAASRKSDPKVELQVVPSRYRYAEEEAMSPERIALKHKAMVKNYFLQLRESETK